MSMSRLFGVPLSDSDTKLIELRKSGYTGPINEKGEKVTSGHAAEVMKALAESRGETVDWWGQ